MLPFSNPRLVAEFPDWPIGGNNRGYCKFAIEPAVKRGTRISRITADKNGKLCKPKYTTYGGKAVIVDGSDGKTYILQLVPMYQAVKVWRHDFMDASIPGLKFQGSTAYADSSPEIYKTLADVVNSVS